MVTRRFTCDFNLPLDPGKSVPVPAGRCRAVKPPDISVSAAASPGAIVAGFQSAMAAGSSGKPSRQKILSFKGPVVAATELSGIAPGKVIWLQSPNLFWPQDCAWCAASEIDLFCTIVAGSEALIGSLLANPHLETWRVFPGDPIAYDSDEINT